MADISVKTTTTDKLRTWPNGTVSAEQPRVTRHTDIWSVGVGGHLTARELRDLVLALNEVGVSDHAVVKHSTNAGGHLNGLTVHHEEDITAEVEHEETDPGSLRDAEAPE